MSVLAMAVQGRACQVSAGQPENTLTTRQGTTSQELADIAATRLIVLEVGGTTGTMHDNHYMNRLTQRNTSH